MSDQPETKICIIGAGLSGLVAAFQLEKASIPYILLEADNRIGGRIHSLYDERQYVGDLGPTWVWPEYQPIAKRWLETLSVKTFAQYNKGAAMVERQVGEQPFRYPLPDQHGIRRMVGGPQAIIDALHAAIDSKQLRLASSVSKIESIENGFKITCTNATTVKAQYVICAIPPRIAARQITWPDTLDAGLIELLQATPTWMATHAKLIVSYDKPYWREQGLSGRIASGVGPIMEAHDHSPQDAGYGALFGFLGWDHSQRKARGENLIDDVVAQFVRCFGPDAKNYKNIQIEDWADNINTCDPRDLAQAMAHPEPMPPIIRDAHLSERLYFAGAETSEISAGLIEGAINSGEQAANKVLAQLKRGY